MLTTRPRLLERSVVPLEKRREAGFAAIDALVALTIMAMTLALTLEATATSRRLAGAALLSERASALLQYLIEAGSAAPGEWSGRSGGLNWRLDVVLQSADPHAPAVRTCRRLATASDPQSRRKFSLSALAYCKPPDPAGSSR